jgi:hypothetical protein
MSNLLTVLVYFWAGTVLVNLMTLTVILFNSSPFLYLSVSSLIGYVVYLSQSNNERKDSENGTNNG